MNATIIKRIAAIENKVQRTMTAAFIMIFWNHNKNTWVIKETFKEGKTRETTIDHYRNYKFDPSFNGSVILDLLDCPEEYQANLFTFTAAEIRQKAALTPESSFSIEYITKENIMCVTEYA